MILLGSFSRIQADARRLLESIGGWDRAAREDGARTRRALRSSRARRLRAKAASEAPLCGTPALLTRVRKMYAMDYAPAPQGRRDGVTRAILAPDFFARGPYAPVLARGFFTPGPPRGGAFLRPRAARQQTSSAPSLTATSLAKRRACTRTNQFDGATAAQGQPSITVIRAARIHRC